MINHYSYSNHHHNSSILKIVPKLFLLIGLLPHNLSAGFANIKSNIHQYSPLIKARRFDLSTLDSQVNNLDESSGLIGVNQPSVTSLFSSNSPSYGLTNSNSYTTSTSSLNLSPGGSIAQSNPALSMPSNYLSGSYGSLDQLSSLPSFNNRFNYYGQPVRRVNSLPYGPSHGYSPIYGRYPFPMKLRGPNPYYRNRLRRNGSKSRRYYSKRYLKPYYGSRRNYRSQWKPRYRPYNSKYNNYDYDYDSRESDSSMIGSESSPSETFYSISSSNSNSGSKDYLKIGGIGSNILNFFTNSLFNRSANSRLIDNNSTTYYNNQSLNSSKESTNDGPFIQFGETKITLKSNDKGGITVTVGRSKI